MNREKRERLSRGVKQERETLDAARENVKGNPHMIQLIDAVINRQDKIIEALNLDIEVTSD